MFIIGVGREGNAVSIDINFDKENEILVEYKSKRNSFFKTLKKDISFKDAMEDMKLVLENEEIML